MVCAMMIARNNNSQFDALTALVRQWSESQVCSLADKLVPTPGFPKDYRSALAAIRRFSAKRTKHVCEKPHQISEEIAKTTDIYRAY
jgi:hypothetical protein